MTEIQMTNGQSKFNQIMLNVLNPVIKRSTPDFIDWELVPNKYNAVARNADGKVWMYHEEPEKYQLTLIWFSMNIEAGPNIHIKNGDYGYKRGTTTWCRSLITRN